MPYQQEIDLVRLFGDVCAQFVQAGPDEVEAAWDTALAADRPMVIDAVVDPAVPLLPPAQPYEKVRSMHAGLAAEDTELARRATAHLRRERADEGFDDPAG